MSRYDLTGQRFNRLVAIKDTGKRKYSNVIWLCQCDCGNLTEVYATRLKRGLTKSCGCLHIEILKKTAKERAKKRIRHGDARAGQQTRLHKIWAMMKNRCNNPNNPHYNVYGQQGIKVCSAWNEYIPFKAWALANGYKENLSIDRIEHKKGYSPENCQWLTRSQNTAKVWADYKKDLDNAFLVGFRLGYALRIPKRRY